MEQRQYRPTRRYRRGVVPCSFGAMGFVFVVFLCCLAVVVLAISAAAEFQHGF